MNQEREQKEAIQQAAQQNLRWAFEALEKEQNPLLSANYAALASGLCEVAGNFGKAAEAASAETLAHIRAYRMSQQPESLEMAQQAAERAVAYAQQSGDPQATVIPLHTLGKIYSEKGLWEQAVEAFDSSLVPALPKEHNYPLFHIERGAHAATAHLAVAFLVSPHNTAFEEAWVKQVIADFENQEIGQTPEDREMAYKKTVWLSGLLNRFGVLLKEHERREEGNAYIAQARQVVEKHNAVVGAIQATLRLEDIQKAENR